MVKAADAYEMDANKPRGYSDPIVMLADHIEEISQARAAGLLREIRDVTKRTEQSLSLVKEYLDGGH